ncbi:MAG TPA: addiction module protein [Steroidobacteraceae bacterium]|nr:addiction module protein [Steroidobacteraceae bacterium]
MNLPLKRMTKVEKLRTMEELWIDITRDEAGYVSPSWHFDELRRTAAGIRSGAVKFTDWEVAKKSLRR